MEGFGFALTFVPRAPAFDKLLRAEPELLLPLLTIDGAPVLALYRTLIAERLQVEIDAGHAAPADSTGLRGHRPPRDLTHPHAGGLDHAR